MPEFSSHEQSTFLPRRLITDNTIATYDCLHFMKRPRSKNNSHCALKLDMMKAYNRVEWSYLAVVLKMGFNHKWVTKIMQRITIASFLVLVNGVKTDDLILHEA